jgi:hypothetical protein
MRTARIIHFTVFILRTRSGNRSRSSYGAADISVRRAFVVGEKFQLSSLTGLEKIAFPQAI